MNRSSDHPHGAFSDASDVHIGIVTALPVEYAAVGLILDAVSERSAKQDPHHYRSGWLPSKDPVHPHHAIVALQAREGTRGAASTCTDMVRSFPNLRVFIMCGIAGGIPSPRDPHRDVRLGDVVAATGGIVDFGNVRRVDGVDSVRRASSGISAALLRADRELQVLELSGEGSWHTHLEAAVARNRRFRRPAGEEDPLNRARTVIGHVGRPDSATAQNTAQRPRVWRGAVGSSDMLLRDVVFRDRLAVEYKVIAVEMEGAGIAEAAESHDRHWFEIRGISDYCDNRTKNDVWHDYAALSAAAYVRGLLSVCPPFGPSRAAAGPSANRLQAIVDALLALPVMSDDYQRRAILAQLPGEIRAAVPDSVTARIHVVGLVRTCERIPGGCDALLSALGLVLGTNSADYARTEDVIRLNWLESS